MAAAVVAREPCLRCDDQMRTHSEDVMSARDIQVFSVPTKANISVSACDQ